VSRGFVRGSIADLSTRFGPDRASSRRRTIGRGSCCLTSNPNDLSNVNVINIHGRGHYADCCEARRVGKTSLDCAHDPRLLHLVAAWSCHLGIHYGERTNDFLEGRGHDSLVWSGGPHASCRDLVAAVAAAKWQPGF